MTDTYELTFRGEPGPMTAAAFPEFDLRAGLGMTVLEGEFVDPAALHGLIERIHSLRLELVSVRLVESDDDNPNPSPSPSENEER